MDIDLILDARVSADELAEQGQLAEQLGFSGIWVSSLLDGRDAFSNLSVLARATQQISIGVIAVNPWDMHPVKISSALHTLNELCNGRARIVIGGGGEALASLGLKPERRVRAVRETIEIIKQTSAGQRFDYSGELYQAMGYGLGWLTAAAPQVYAGANQQQMLRMTGRVADGAMLSDLPPRQAADAMQFARNAAVENGRVVSDLWFSSFTAWHVYPDLEKAQEEARRWLLLRGLFRPWVLAEFLEEPEIDCVMSNEAAFLDAFVSGSGDVRGVPESVLIKLVQHLTLTATPDALDDVMAELHAYNKSAGLSAISLRLYEQPQVSMELLATSIMPGLK